MLFINVHYSTVCVDHDGIANVYPPGAEIEADLDDPDIQRLLSTVPPYIKEVDYIEPEEDLIVILPD